jgi:Fe-Mn family superoxide dismutase
MLRPILGFLALALAIATPRAEAADAPFALAPLPYPADALEPVIDAKTMEIHHGRHHKAYVDNLNAQVAKIPELSGMSLLDMQRQMSRFPTAVRNNGGGHWNHDFFWNLMTRPGTGGEPSGALAAAIERDFGSFDAMKEAFQQAGLSRFGSGWVWLIVRPDGHLAITSTPNQDNPLMDLVPEAERGTPILGNDVWEHAYYLAYQNRRGDYLSAWWQLVDWTKVGAHFDRAIAELGPKDADAAAK